MKSEILQESPFLNPPKYPSLRRSSSSGTMYLMDSPTSGVAVYPYEMIGEYSSTLAESLFKDYDPELSVILRNS